MSMKDYKEAPPINLSDGICAGVGDTSSSHTMNTPDAEWEKQVEEIRYRLAGLLADANVSPQQANTESQIWDCFNQLTSRDTYWKERYEALHEKHTDETYQLGKKHQLELVRREVQKMKYKGMKYAKNGQPLTIRDGQKEVHNLALDTLLDNLK